MQSLVTKRFLECVEYLKERSTIRSYRQFSLSLDYLAQSFNDIKQGKRDVTLELVRKAIETYDLNPSYLFEGLGTKLKEESTTDPIVSIVTDKVGQERIVHVPVSAQAGYGSNLHDTEFMGELPTFSLPDYRFQSGTHRCFDIAGDSMEPTLYSGDKVVCSFVEMENWPCAIKDNLVYVIITNADVVIKRVGNKINDNGHLELYSDNTYYDPYVLGVDEIKEIWYVKMKISPFMPSPNNVRNALHEEVSDLKKNIDQQSQLIRNLNTTIEKMLKQNRSRI